MCCGGGESGVRGGGAVTLAILVLIDASKRCIPSEIILASLVVVSVSSACCSCLYAWILSSTAFIWSFKTWCNANMRGLDGDVEGGSREVRVREAWED